MFYIAINEIGINILNTEYYLVSIMNSAIILEI